MKISTLKNHSYSVKSAIHDACFLAESRLRFSKLLKLHQTKAEFLVIY